MLSKINRDSWLYALLGVTSIVFGVLTFAWPGITLGVLVILFGAFALVDGIALLVALARRDVLVRSHPWAVGAMAVVGILAGIGTFLWPGITAIALLYVVAVWAIVVGILQVVFALRVRTLVAGEFWMALGGLLSIAFGALLLIFPGSGLVTLAWLVGIWAMAYGVSDLGLAYRLHTIHDELDKLGKDLNKAASAA